MVPDVCGIRKPVWLEWNEEVIGNKVREVEKVGGTGSQSTL